MCVKNMKMYPENTQRRGQKILTDIFGHEVFVVTVHTALCRRVSAIASGNL